MKVFSFLSALLISTAIFSVEPAQNPPSDVQIELYGELLFLQPNGSNLTYAVQAYPFNNAIAVPILSPNWVAYEIDPSYGAAFEVGASIIVPGVKTSVKTSWERSHTSDSNTHGIASNENMIGPEFDIGPNSANYSAATGKANFNFDLANLLLKQSFSPIYRFTPNLFAGLAYSRINQSLLSTYSNAGTSISRSVETNSTFNGVGPQIGLDFSYKIAGDFLLTGQSSASLIMGQMKNELTYKSTDPFLDTVGNPQPNQQTTQVPHRAQLVPGFEEKLGFSYAHAFKNWNLSVSAGYRVQIYLDAVQSFDMTAPQVLPSLTPGATVDSGVYAVGFERTLSNFILSGPYFALKLGF